MKKKLKIKEKLMIYGRIADEFKPSDRIHFYTGGNKRPTLYYGNQVSKLRSDESLSWHVQVPLSIQTQWNMCMVKLQKEWEILFGNRNKEKNQSQEVGADATPGGWDLCLVLDLVMEECILRPCTSGANTCKKETQHPEPQNTASYVKRRLDLVFLPRMAASVIWSFFAEDK